MPIPLLLAMLWLRRLIRRPMDPRLKRRELGAFSIFALGWSVVGLWALLRPDGMPTEYLAGELSGVLAVYLMVWSLVLATRSRWLEPWFGGLDRMYFWHKKVAVLGMLLLVPHIAFTGDHAGRQTGTVGIALGVVSLFGLTGLVAVSLPRVGRILRLSYYRWQFLHRLTGLFVALGGVHGLLLDPVISSSAVLEAVFLAVGAVGLVCYLYEELLMRPQAPGADYTVEYVTRPADDIVDLSLAPTGHGIEPRAGQFVFVRVGGDNAWREHPFSIAATDPDGRLRLSVRALGRDTRRLHDRLAIGQPAKVTGPYGMFDFTLGGRDQIWVAGGIGVVPFLSWLQAISVDADHSIDLFYSAATEADAVYLPEVLAQSGRHPSIRVHPVFTRTHGHLTGADIDDTIATPVAELHAFLCGPASMVRDLSRDLRRRGTPREYLHAEHFAFR